MLLDLIPRLSVTFLYAMFFNLCLCIGILCTSMYVVGEIVEACSARKDQFQEFIIRMLMCSLKCSRVTTGL